MGDFDPSFVHALAVQSWTLYSVGMLLIFLRMQVPPEVPIELFADVQIGMPEYTGLASRICNQMTISWCWQE